MLNAILKNCPKINNTNVVKQNIFLPKVTF
jgi:hypothetical protein